MSELDVLRIVSERLEKAGLRFMLTGSFALAYYATPRMTRDIDLVVQLRGADVAGLVAAFADDFYVDAESVSQAVQAERLFNLMHLESGIKIDIIVCKASLFRRTEFDRRQHVDFAGVSTWIVSPEDLLLSKLVWARESDSELQLRDARALLMAGLDEPYLDSWAAQLGVGELLRKLRP